MARATWVLAGTTAIGFVMSAYLAFGRDRTCATPAEPVATQAPSHSTALPPPAPTRTPRVALDEVLRQTRARRATPDEESPLEARARATEAIAALLGRQPGESDADYRARLAQMMQLALAGPRARAVEMRHAAEAKAHVTPEQSARLDDAFTEVYAGMLASTNDAIAARRLSPYKRDVPAWLQFAGEIGHELETANHTIEQILQPAQVRAMYDAGFDWSEYLALQAPWENIAVLPPARDK